MVMMLPVAVAVEVLSLVVVWAATSPARAGRRSEGRILGVALQGAQSLCGLAIVVDGEISRSKSGGIEGQNQELAKGLRHLMECWEKGRTVVHMNERVSTQAYESLQ